jgi:hypothetical protein
MEYSKYHSGDLTHHKIKKVVSSSTGYDNSIKRMITPEQLAPVSVSITEPELPVEPAPTPIEQPTMPPTTPTPVEPTIPTTTQETDKNKEKILDPLSVIIKLSILSKKAVGTKICIQNNVLYIQDIGIFQPLVRYYFNNSRDDLQYLYNPIEIACKYFLQKSEFRNSIMKIFMDAKEGISKLIEMYKTDAIVHSLYMYYNIIENYLGEKVNTKLFIADTLTAYYTDSLSTQLNENWTHEKIGIIMDLIKYYDNKSDTIVCIDDFLRQINLETVSIINRK